MVLGDLDVKNEIQKEWENTTLAGRKILLQWLAAGVGLEFLPITLRYSEGMTHNAVNSFIQSCKMGSSHNSFVAERIEPFRMLLHVVTPSLVESTELEELFQEYIRYWIKYQCELGAQGSEDDAYLLRWDWKVGNIYGDLFFTLWLSSLMEGPEVREQIVNPELPGVNPIHVIPVESCLLEFAEPPQVAEEVPFPEYLSFLKGVRQYHCDYQSVFIRDTAQLLPNTHWLWEEMPRVSSFYELVLVCRYLGDILGEGGRIVPYWRYEPSEQDFDSGGIVMYRE